MSASDVLIRRRGIIMSSEEKTDFRPIARALGTVLEYAANDFIFREGDPPRYMYMVLKGSVEVSTKSKVIEIVREGKAFGMLSLLDDMPRTNTARAVEPCELALLDKKKFRFMIEEAPNFVWFVLGEFGSRLRATNALL
jgi:CRP/FNR family cyclic AMP-dependent transcriptional regulator